MNVVHTVFINDLQVARHLYTWTANSTFFDFFDRALWNGIVGNQASASLIFTASIDAVR